MRGLFTFLTTFLLGLLATLGTKSSVSGDSSNAYLSLPNRSSSSRERILGFGMVKPYPYFQKPSYRYPVYDKAGRGRLLYGYGGNQVFPYTKFTPIEGVY